LEGSNNNNEEGTVDHNDDRTPEELAGDRTAELEWMSLASVYSTEDVEAMLKSEGLLKVATRLAMHVQLLTLKVAELDARLAQEVRTRRLVIVDDAGVERIIGEIGLGDMAEVVVRTGVSDDYMSLHASSEQLVTGLYMSRGGNGAADLHGSAASADGPHCVSLWVGGVDVTDELVDENGNTIRPADLT
jgi:hypothetical protein